MISSQDDMVFGESPAPIVVMGSMNRDIRLQMARLPVPGETVAGHGISSQAGGKGANQAVAAAMLGATVLMVGCVGDDSVGAFLTGKLAERGVDTSGVRVVADEPSGTAVVMVNDSGENMIVVIPGANGRVGAPEVESVLGQVGRSRAIVLSQMEVPERSVLSLMHALETSRSVVRMLNVSPAAGVAAGMLGGIDFVIVNELEAAQLVASQDAGSSQDAAADGMHPGADGMHPGSGSTHASGARPPGLALDENALVSARRIIEAGVKNVVVTLGEHGAVLCNGHEEIRRRAPAITPVDTTGAGDQFLGMFAFAISRGLSNEVALGMAVDVASVSTTRVGAQDSFVSAGELSLLSQPASAAGREVGDRVAK